MELRTEGSRPRLRTQKNLRPRPWPRTVLPKTDPLEAKTGMLEAKTKDQGHNADVIFKKKTSSKISFRRSPKNVFMRLLAFSNENFYGSKNSVVLGQGQCNFRGLEASTPRPRTSKCVLEDVFEDSTSNRNTKGVQLLRVFAQNSRKTIARFRI